MRKLFLVSLLISLPFLATSDGRYSPRQKRGFAPGPRRTDVKSSIVELDLSYDFSVTGKTDRISLTILLPRTIPDRQNILSTRYLPKPSRIFDNKGNRYAEFVFVRPDKRTRIEIFIKARLFKYDLITALGKRRKDSLEDREMEDFLKQEKYIEKDNERIQEIAKGLEGKVQIETVLKIYDYVTDNMEYGVPSKRGRGAVEALRQGKGDCTEYADLFVALSRAKNIPARVVTGYTTGLNSTSSKHNWAEVYLQGYGWVPFDPSTGDMGSSSVRGRVLRMRPAYIHLSHIRNDEVLGDYSFGAYAYSGDRPGFKDSVKFRILAPPMLKPLGNPTVR